MSAINIDTSNERTINLLQLLSIGELPIEEAQELRGLLMRDMDVAKRQGDLGHEMRLRLLVETVDSYIRGELNLRRSPRITVSNVP